MNARVLFIVLLVTLAQISYAVAFDARLRRSDDFAESAPSEPLFETEAIAIPPRRIRYYRTGGTILLG